MRADGGLLTELADSLVSKQRTEILPGAGWWDSFFHKDVQSVLKRRFTVDALSQEISGQARQEFLAWPIIAYETVDALAKATQSKAGGHTGFLCVYKTDRQFAADLLCVLTRYHQTPENEKALRRRVAEQSNVNVYVRAPLNFSGDQIEPSRLMNWKEIAQTLQGEITLKNLNQLQVELSRERTRRNDLIKKWQTHFDAYWGRDKERRLKKQPWLPLDHIRFEP